jgi:hypothetical protein
MEKSSESADILNNDASFIQFHFCKRERLPPRRTDVIQITITTTLYLFLLGKRKPIPKNIEAREPNTRRLHITIGKKRNRQTTNAPNTDTISSLFCVTEQERTAAVMFHILYRKTRFIRKKDSI